jgi:hypothetical protein
MNSDIFLVWLQESVKHAHPFQDEILWVVMRGIVLGTKVSEVHAASTQRHNPENLDVKLHRCVNLKSLMCAHHQTVPCF